MLILLLMDRQLDWSIDVVLAMHDRKLLPGRRVGVI